MEAFALTASVAVVIVSGTYLVLTLRAEAQRRKRERVLAKMLELASDAMENEIRRSGRTGIAVDSPEGRAILDRIRLGCTCPNCEEERRIAHAEQQKRGER
ncbi:hypothetical protein [Leucobacter tenebrionis]|uniref:hypothetical protein n=1 Tax=Leucobacter tenebrionis TaxID=2873270 RepID=UPI001CA6B4F0|nr:hypothetical protein [Leucobacter tenebrionis]QZY52895.1 hypothetical protein KVY00_05530 [Leucobacter tenebrionis]